MSSSDRFDRAIVLLIAVFVLLAPVMILVFTLGFLVLVGDLVLGRVTFVELLELYLIDLVLFVAFAYALYRLTLRVVNRRVPTSLDDLDFGITEEDVGEAPDDRE